MTWFDPIYDFLVRIIPYMPAIVGMLVLVAISLLLALWLLVRRSKKKAAETEADADRREVEQMDALEPFQLEPDDLPLLPLGRSFRHALKLLKAHVSGRDWRYAIPWYLLIGPEGSGKSTLIRNTNMTLPVGAPAEDWEDVRPACKWWFFDRGVVLDVAGQLVRARGAMTSDRRGWAQLLRLLDRHRPRRPIDGVVLTLPIEDLLDAEGRPRPSDVVADRAEALYKKLWQAQTSLGLAFPVYVVVTKADRLVGFKSFVGELPEAQHADMLGWSSPYSFETEFRADWIDEAVDQIVQAVRSAQMEIFAERAELADAEGLFQLPGEIAQLREPLRAALRHLFKASAYHEAFSLRGVFLAGDGGAPPPAGLRPIPVLPGVYSGPKEEMRPVFLTDLFEDKIFAEHGVARPAKRALLSRNRTALTAQVATLALIVLGGIGMAVDYGALRAGVASVTPFVREVQADMRETEALRQAAIERGEAPVGRGGFDREKALTLLEGMARVEAGGFARPTMPTSWLSALDDRVTAVATDAFNLFILQSMRAALQQRGEALVAGRLDAVAAGSGAESDGRSAARAEGGGAEFERGPAFERLERFVRELRRFESALDRYNHLQERQDLNDVKALVEYLFGMTLPADFLEDADLYQAALARIDYRELALQPFRAPAVARYNAYLDEAIPALFAENPLMVNLRRLGISLDDAANRRSSGAALLEEIRARIEATRDQFTAPRYAWMETPTYDVAVGFSGFLERVGGSALLGGELAAAFERRARLGVEDVVRELPTLRSLAVGPLLKRDGQRATLEFSEPIAALDGVIGRLFAQPFMAEGALQPMPPAPPTGVPALWRPERLDDALALIDTYNDFMSADLQRAPSALHSMIRGASAERLERTVNDKIARALEVGRDAAAAGLRAEEALRREVQSFTAVAPDLARIMAAYDDLGREDSFLDLSDLAVGHAVGMVEEADSLFAQEAFYEPQGGDFRWWDGGARMALEAYRARDRFELIDILARQRERIQILADQYVRPLIDFLDARELRLPEAADRLVTKWRRIAEELQKYALRRADNSVAELEGFILGPMMEITFATCTDVLDRAGAGEASGGGDFFVQRVRRLERGLRQRCADLAGVQAQTAYGAVADAFDERLAGRYPFVADGWREDMTEVSPRELEAFFAVYDAEAGPARRALEEAVDLGFSRDRALDFLDRMDQVRALFGPWLDAPGPDDAPVFDVAATFRVNRAREAGANQVIEWALEVGPTRLDQRSGERTARWSLGEPVEILLRWAENSTAVPAATPDRPNLIVDRRTVRLRYDNAWSLLEAIRRHRAGSDDFEQFVDPRPHTLRVDAPTRPAAGGGIETARLFIRVELTARGGGEAQPVVVPVFPTRAPEVLE
ncbi:MAG: type VI secretion protein IcmF/TssM N-terminal domain-containing protein [Marivibrio sp.]|uniref:type VI secretion protein IcmF/TssM N-terminal domain-containing protein n=1 Tax=Marivibrio sp. TaxID=2039719 RepID=UPI0032EDC35B